MTIRAMALASLCAAALGAQARPSTDVWVVPMRRGGSVPAFGAPVNATHRTGRSPSSCAPPPDRSNTEASHRKVSARFGRNHHK